MNAWSLWRPLESKRTNVCDVGGLKPSPFCLDVPSGLVRKLCGLYTEEEEEKKVGQRRHSVREDNEGPRGRGEESERGGIEKGGHSGQRRLIRRSGAASPKSRLFRLGGVGGETKVNDREVFPEANKTKGQQEKRTPSLSVGTIRFPRRRSRSKTVTLRLFWGPVGRVFGFSGSGAQSRD